ncbi:uncharacterized protein LOC135083760 [Ostrinia nubilalis]|uniref:uncharacterized protein LOC135083760 n=1 Tax=Ostrinia nubilalis TaxID=29057 RepID=UPI0030823FC5
MSNFGILSTFDHNVQDWKTYKSRISQWFIANDIDAKNDTSGIKRRAILLSALADGTFKLAADLALPKELQDLPYGQIINLLDGHFTPKRCGFSERYKFYAATQQHGESHPQWAARLRGLTAHCGFKDVEEALRDRFVMGMVAGPEREKLFAQDMDGLSLAKAVELAESIHCARAGAASASAAPLQETVFKIVNSSSKPKNNVRSDVKCLVCGRSNHESSQCRFANYKCRKCNVKGHLRKMCTKVNFISTEDCSQIKHYGGTNKYIYKVGDKVNYKKYSNNKKFEWCIGTVVRVIGSVLYLIRDDLTSVIMKKHKNQILPYKGEEGGKTLQQHWDYDDFLVEDNSSLTQNQPLGSSEQTTIPSYTRESGRLRNIPRVDYRAFF